MSIYRFLATLTLGLSGMSALLAQTTTPTPVTREFSFPPVGVSNSETMQVNLYNQATNASNGTAASCTGTVSFVNGAGKTLSGPTNFTVVAGAIQSVSLPGTTANTNTAPGSRAEVRALISLTVTRGTPCSLVESLETFDSTSTGTGFTHVHLSNSTGGFPGPAAIFGQGSH